MSQITSQMIREQAQSTLTSFYEKKFRKDINDLVKAHESGDSIKVNELEEKLTIEKEKYELSNWIDNELPKMMKGLKFGTHISKGIHPSSKGDNVFFQPIVDLDEEYIVGSHTLDDLSIDANGNAAALPLAAFLETPINETTLQELIISDSKTLEKVFNDDQKISAQIQQQLKEVITYIPIEPFADGRNKHLLWPLSENAIDEDKYINLIPLHPSSLTNHLYKTIQNLRFGHTVTEARDGRRKNQFPYINYPVIKDLAVVNLGGNNAQNVGRLNAQQRGINYLLPSYPPIFVKNGEIPLNRSDTSIFNHQLKLLCRDAFNTIKRVSQLNLNNQRIRLLRQDALDEIITTVILIADNIKKEWLPNWSEDYSLNKEEKIWLDPDLSIEKAESNWAEKVAEHFAHWLNQWLQRELKNLKDDFTTQEFLYWKNEMHDILKAKYTER